MYRSIFFIIFLIISTGKLRAQEATSSELFQTLKVNDSIIFDASFNTCNLKALEKLISDDLEFYHDKGGIMTGKKNFIENTKNGLCKSPYDLKRELVTKSLVVFPLRKNTGELYGAIQQGVHRFYEDERETSIAKFTHLWILEEEMWKLKRVLSYNHISGK